MSIYQFLTLAIVHLLGILSPGQTTVSVARFSIKNPRQIFSFIAGIAISEAIYIVLAISSFSVFLAQNKTINFIFRICSALYLIYISFGMIKNKKFVFDVSNESGEVKKKIDKKIAFLQGFTINTLNPSTILFYLSIIAGFINKSMSAIVISSIIGYLILASFIIYYLIGFLLSKYQQKIAPYFYYIEKLCGVFFIYIACKLFLK